MVAVQHDAEVGQAVVRSKHKGFPALALFHLAVTQDGVDIDGLTGVLGTQCHAAGGAHALTQTAGGHIHARHTVHVGVALQVAADLAQGLEVLHREEPTLSQRGVQRRSRMALGEHQAVAVRVLGILRIHLHLYEIEVRQHLGDIQAAARMAALGAVSALDHAHADVAGVFCQGKFFCICHLWSSRMNLSVCIGYGTHPGRTPRCAISQVYIIYSMQKRQGSFGKMYIPWQNRL